MPMMPFQIDMPGAAGTPAKAIDLNSAAVQANFCPQQPTVIRQFSLTILNDVAAAGTVILKRRPTAGSTTGEAAISTIELTTAHTQGKCVYEDGLNVKMVAGEELVVEVTDVTGAGDLAKATVWGEVSYEAPGNNTNMVATA